MTERAKGVITWEENSESGKAAAMNEYSESIKAYASVYKSSASDFSSLRNIKPDFNRSDYDYYRPNSALPQDKRKAMQLCMRAYKNTGIIRNVLDLMGDFGCQGINLIHRDKSAESFYQQWFKKVNGKERSERFLNNLYRCGNVVIYRSYAEVTPTLAKFMKSLASDIKIEEEDVTKNEIPFRYNFFNPLNLDIKSDGRYYLNVAGGAKLYAGGSFNTSYRTAYIPKDVMDSLPKSLQNDIKNNKRDIPLEEDRLSVFHYKKDDWEAWADPLILAILDDIMMLERMKLADISALDGAISNIRLWTLGSLEDRIFPTKEAIDRLREILASNQGGGTMELVWGPELSFKESATQVHKFLGSAKYENVMNSIYGGIGVPPTLTGQAGGGSGFTNNFISLKTLVERLQYGRDQLVKFWEKEIELVRKAMGFRYAAEIRFDQMSLSDENAEKLLFIQLADRDIISHETLLERFKESSKVEKTRLSNEKADREASVLPDKAGPFHNGNFGQEVEKMDLQHQNDVQINKMNLQAKKEIQASKPKPKVGGVKKKKSAANGRPKGATDQNGRKKRIAKPKSKAGVAQIIEWTNNTWDRISENINTGFLSVNNKTNLRQLSKAQIKELETIKVDVLTNIEPLESFDDKAVYDIVIGGYKPPREFTEMLENSSVSIDSMHVESYRKAVLASYVEYLIS